MDLSKSNSACVYFRYGDEQNLSWVDCPIPRLRPGQVLVRVRSISINPIDWKILKGEQRVITGLRILKNRILGTDFFGEIVKTYPSSTRKPLGLQVGDFVFGMVNPLTSGCAVRYLAVSAETCCVLPKDNARIEAAGLAGSGNSAWRAFATRPADWWRGKTVLLNAAAGGVGSLLLQLLVEVGAQVSTRSSSARFELLTRLGSYECLDYHQGLPDTQWDALIDCHGGLYGTRIPRHIKRSGIYIPLSIPNEQIPRLIAYSVVLKIVFTIDTYIILAAPSQTILEKIRQKLIDRKLEAIVDSIYDAPDIAIAVKHSMSGHVAGKIIVRVE